MPVAGGLDNLILLYYSGQYKFIRNVMKIYRRSIWKTCTFKFGLLPGYIFLLLLGGYYLHDVKIPMDVLIYLIVICIAGFVGIVIRCFYLILANDQLIVKNRLCPFWYEGFYYADIKKIYIEQSGVIGVCYIQVITSKNRKHNRKYILDFVSPKDYHKLIPMLKEKGVHVETKNLTYLL